MFQKTVLNSGAIKKPGAFLFAGQRALGVPYKSDLDTLHKTITDVTFAESIANLPAKFLPRVADFNETDDIVNCGDDSTVQNVFDGGGSILVNVNMRTGGQNDIGMIVNKGWRFYTGTASGTGVKLRLYCLFSDTDGFWETTNETITFGVDYKISIKYDNSSVSNDPIFNINGVEYSVGSGLSEIFTPIGTRTTDVGTDLAIGNRAALSRAFDGLISDVRLYSREITAQEASDYNSDVELSTTDLKASYRTTGQGDYEYDLSGNENHGTWAGTGSRYDFDLDGSTYANDNGYSLWQKAGEDDIQVGFDINGSALSLTPGTNIPAGYTKTRDIQAGGTRWNMADALLDFDPDIGTDAAVDMFDRSNLTIHTVACQAPIYYNSLKPYRWHINEIVDPRIYDTFFEAAYLDRIFGKVVLDGTDVTRYDEQLNYGTQKTGADLTEIQSYCKITDIYP